MLRRFTTVMFAVLLALFSFGGLANAAVSAPYPPPPTDLSEPGTINDGGTVVDANGNPVSDGNSAGGNVIIVVNGQPLVDGNGNPVLDTSGNPVLDANGNPFVDANGNPVIGGIFTFSGSGFTPGETITFAITDGPLGLRSSAGLSKLTPAAPAPTKADAQGNFSVPVVITQTGTFTITATGALSGHQVSATFKITGGASDSGTNSGGLAYTGASIAGPLAIGFVALFAGLALLFFGTRGVRRRKSLQASQ